MTDRLLDIELDYACGEMSVSEIAAKYGVDARDIQLVARQHGWSDAGIHHCNEQRLKFVDEYLKDLKPHLAAKRAGYGEHYGSRLMAVPEIRDAINARMRARAARSRISQDAVIAELGRIALANVRDLYDDKGTLIPVDQLPEDVSAAIREIEVTIGGNELLATKKIKLHDKLAALTTLAKHHGLLTEKVEMTGKDGAPLLPEMSDAEAARRIAFVLAKAARQVPA